MLSDLPYPNPRHIALHITPAAERSLRSSHPWLYDQSIRKQNREGQPGDLAIVFDKKNRFLALGLYDPYSPIRVKILQHNSPATINPAWFALKLQQAAAQRHFLAQTQTTGYRLIYGENDGLPGLILDRYADTLVMKLYTTAWVPHLHNLIPAIGETITYQHLVLRLSRQAQAQTAHLHGLHDGQILSPSPLPLPVYFEENGLRFSADVVHGHKTGFFFDHRENRLRVKGLASGRHVLDAFAYVGAFSLYAAAGGASSVLSVDISPQALDAARYNFHLNTALEPITQARHEIMVEDAFRAMHTLRDEGRRFDMVVVDPPAFAKSSAEVQAATGAYARLTRLAVDLLNAGGVFVMASCSSRVSPQAFFEIIRHNIQRPVREIARTGHAPDHPIGFPEGEYLKCFFAYVD